MKREMKKMKTKKEKRERGGVMGEGRNDRGEEKKKS